MYQQILQLLSAINIRLNLWESNAKKTEELPALSEIDPEGLIRVSIDGESKKMPVGMILNAFPDALPDAILVAGSMVLDEEERTYLIDGFSWRKNEVTHTPAPYTTSEIPEEAPTYSRLYYVLGDATGAYIITSGDPYLEIPVIPTPIPNTIYLTQFTVNGTAIGEPEEPIIGSDDYKKIYLAEQRITEEILEYTLPTDGRTNFIFTVGGFDMEGFTIPSGHEHLFTGKLFFLYNLSEDPITLKHNTGTAEILYNFSDETNYVLAPKTKAQFQYSVVYGLQLVSGGGGSNTNLIVEQFDYTDSQTFTLSNNYSQVFLVMVQGQGALNTAQYDLIAPNQVEILDVLNDGDYLVIVYANALVGVQPYYTKSQVDDIIAGIVPGKNVIYKTTVDSSVVTGTTSPIFLVTITIPPNTVPNDSNIKLKVRGRKTGTNGVFSLRCEGVFDAFFQTDMASKLGAEMEREFVVKGAITEYPVYSQSLASPNGSINEFVATSIDWSIEHTIDIGIELNNGSDSAVLSYIELYID